MINENSDVFGSLCMTGTFPGAIGVRLSAHFVFLIVSLLLLVRVLLLLASSAPRLLFLMGTFLVLKLPLHFTQHVPS